ncbi:hypothetical protein XA68_18213 [Ophiocordyceps unilateralis]|uniref:Protein transport protein sec16 n=1 Tax=Ophiocordyceps unilateralis TaxID=268505 RepID=A0A2A9PS58_OPHUN|nr:hypothetical protein XA68_18213 [Ophiocordyceps unilateralis]
MANGPPNSSWHPALMPNSSPPQLAAERDAPDTTELEARHVSGQESVKERLVEAWFSEGAADDGVDSWLIGDDTGDPTDNPPDRRDEPQPLQEDYLEHRPVDVASEPVDELPEHTEGPPPSARPRTMNSQHSSSMSFARTVSHEVSFHDDDDHEWNRSDAHPSPAVAHSPDDEGEDNASFPSTQAQHVLEETERSKPDAQNHSAVKAFNSLSPESPHAGADNWPEPLGISQAIASEEQNMEARYEEGIPLMSRNNAAREPVDAFADENDEVDFFTQIHPEAENKDPELPAMERKSTTQAMGGVLGASDDSVSEADNVEVKSSGHQHPVPDHRDEPIVAQAPVEDLATKWQAAFAGDDEEDFLVEDQAAGNDAVDAFAFLGSDDEGLLDDDGLLPDDEAVVEQSSTPAASDMRQPSTASLYTPVNIPSRQSSSSYVPTTNAPLSPSTQQPTSTPFTLPQLPAQPPRPEAWRAQSFADKSKGGYSSPYDLPTDLLSNTVKPRKRTSLQQLPREQPPPPPRSTSIPNQAFSPSSLRNQSSFFEELPVTVRSRPNSRQSNPPNPWAPAGHATGPPVSAAPPPPAASGLVAPESAGPYATVPQHSAIVSLPPPSANASRYSPAPMGHGGHQGAGTQPSTARYSPAPSAPRSGSSYGAVPPQTAPPQAVLPHLPRTSSPLAHFESSSDRIQRSASLPNGDASHADRRSNSFEARLTRVSSLPPTREVDEEEEDKTALANRSVSSAQPTRPGHVEPKPYSAPSLATLGQPQPSRSYVPAAVPPPPMATFSNYVPQPAPTAQPGFVPPPRPSTHSPPEFRPVDSQARPSTAHALSPPAPMPHQLAYAPSTRNRGQSLTVGTLPPTDGTEHDRLERWRGAPLLTWGVGGSVVTSFPKSISRYTMNQPTPTVWRTCGEIKVQNIKDILPLADRLSKFPGPLKGKSKKKETLTWLAAGIEAQERDLGALEFSSHLSLEAKRGVERLLLWKLLRVFIEFDGTLEGSAAVEKAVKDVLSPNISSEGTGPPVISSIRDGQSGPVTSMMADGAADAAATEQIRSHLLDGNREVAVWSAVDKRLWGHAMLISHTVSPDLYKRVAQEFVRKEVNYPGHNNESIAALYKVLSGNFDDCVDELVPIHARVGLQLVSTESASEPAKDAMDGLDKWRETLTLILNNRSADDARALNALGKLLSSYGRAEAAQICFIFSRSVSVFGGLDDPVADFVLLGSDHRQQSDQFAKETEALQLSEVYEYGLSLAGGPAAAAGAPHLAAYKLQHAVTLAEYGYRDKALQYCDAIDAAMMSQTRRSAYHHAILETAVHDFMTRLRQAPRDASSSWISKPSMNKVSDSMWNRFNKFVAGDDGGNGGNGGNGEGDTGPFARVASTPNLSRSPSISNFEVYGGGGSPGFVSNPAMGAAPATSSRYAPAAAQPGGMGNPHPPAPPSSGRTSSEYPRNPYEPAFVGPVSPQAPASSSYAPARHPVSGLGFGPVLQDVTRVVPSGNENPTSMMSTPVDHHPQMLQESPSIYSPSENRGSDAQAPEESYRPHGYGYEPRQVTSPQQTSGESGGAGGGGDYETPSYQPHGYEPPSYGPTAEDGHRAQPKKSFTDDEADSPVSGPDSKSKADKDRENAEMFRKAAEEDAKRAASQKSTKKGWGFGGWFGGSKKNEASIGDAAAGAGKPVRAKLGEASSFVYDPELKRWVNKKPGAENVEVKKATPPPPRATPKPAANGMQPPPPPTAGNSPGAPPRLSQPSVEHLGLAPPSVLSRSASNSETVAGGPPSRPPSRPATSMSNASSIDDLLGAAAPRKGTQKKARKSGRYVDVMAK